jgi:hypothetical protein
MKSIQRLAIVFACILIVSTSVVSATRNDSGDWLLVHSPLSQTVSLFNPTSRDLTRVNTLHRADINTLWLSPNGKWLYFEDWHLLWAFQLFTGKTRLISAHEGVEYYDMREYLSADNTTVFYYETGLHKRLDTNTAQVNILDVPLPEAFDPNYPEFWFLPWLPDAKRVYTIWKDNNFYQISRDGTNVEPIDFVLTKASPDGVWSLSRDDENAFVVNLVDNKTYQMPNFGERYVHMDWTPAGDLILRHIGRHGAQKDLMTIYKFTNGEWTLLAKDRLRHYRSDGGQSRPISPDHTHILYFNEDYRMFVLDLLSEQETKIGPGSKYYYWNETGEWFVYFRFEDSNILSLFHYDVKSHASTRLYSYDISELPCRIRTVSGTDFVILYSPGDHEQRDILIDVKTGQTQELDPDVDVISKWNLPEGPPPRYGLHAVIVLLLVGLPIARKVARRKLSA